MPTQLIYQSFAISSLKEEDIQDILHVARIFNTEHHITGCLLFYEMEFLQILEGEKEIIDSLYSRIKKDKRHTNVTTIYSSYYPERIYPDWNMAYHPLQTQEMKMLEHALAIQDFDRLYQLRENAPESQRLFHFIANDILENPYKNS